MRSGLPAESLSGSVRSVETGHKGRLPEAGISVMEDSRRCSDALFSSRAICDNLARSSRLAGEQPPRLEQTLHERRCSSRYQPTAAAQRRRHIEYDSGNPSTNAGRFPSPLASQAMDNSRARKSDPEGTETGIAEPSANAPVPIEATKRPSCRRILLPALPRLEPATSVSSRSKQQALLNRQRHRPSALLSTTEAAARGERLHSAMY